MRGARTLFRTLTPFNLPVGGFPGGHPAKPDSAQTPLSAAKPLRASLPLPLRRTAQGGGQSDLQAGLAKGTRHPNSGALVLRPLPLRVATAGPRPRRPSIPAGEGLDRRSVHLTSAVSLASTKEAGWHPGQPRLSHRNPTSRHFRVPRLTWNKIPSARNGNFAAAAKKLCVIRAVAHISSADLSTGSRGRSASSTCR